MDTGSRLASGADAVAAKRRARDDLRASAEAALDTAEAIADIERKKLELDPEDPEARELSSESAVLGARLATTTQVESDIADELGREQR